MKKLFGMMLLCATMVLSFYACSDDKEEEVFVTKSLVVGTWDVILAEQDGESFNVPYGYIYMKLNNDGTYRTTMLSNSYIGTYKIEGNTVVGTTLDPIKEYYRFTSLEGNTATINYSNSTGEKYKFKAIKR